MDLTVSKEIKSCPFLGTFNDSETNFRFPTESHYCYCCDPKEPISLSHQEKYCLTKIYKPCPFYQDGLDDTPPPEIHEIPDITEIHEISKAPDIREIPEGTEIHEVPEIHEIHDSHEILEFLEIPEIPEVPELEAEPESDKPPRRNWLLLLEAIGFIIILIIIFLNPFRINLPSQLSFLSISPTDSPTPTLAQPIDTPTLAISPSPLMILEDTQKPTQTPTPIPTNTPFPLSSTPGPKLGTPFGENQEYLIHKVTEGENLLTITGQYNTEENLVLIQNPFLLTSGIQPGQTIIIMPGITEITNQVPLFHVYLDSSIEINTASLQFGVTEEDFRKYNDLGPGDSISSDRWLIYPAPDIESLPLTPTPNLLIDLTTALTEPFGPDQSYILHKVSSGESLPTIANRYSTTSEVIQKANRIEGSVRPDQVLVIILGQSDPTGIPRFEAVNIFDDISIEDLALFLGVDASDLIFYNNLDIDSQIQSGQWIIYPAY